jgi:hypothetical protein
MASSKRPSKKTERRTTLTAMARATQRSTESPKSSTPPRTAKISMPPSPPFFDLPRRDELPPPYDDESGFIDLDKLREAAMAEASIPSTPPPMSPLPMYQSRTAPPVAATLPAPPEETARRSSTAMGIIVGSAIAAAGIAASFFIVSRGIDVRDLGHQGAKHQAMAMKVEAPRAAPAAAAPTAFAPGAAPPATQAAPATNPAPAPAAADTSETASANNDAPGSANARDLGDVDSNDRLDPKERALRARRARARRAKWRAEKNDAVATGGDTAPDPAFAQALQKSAESNVAAAPAGAAPDPEPAPRTAPLAAPVGPPGLAAAIQKASGVEATPAPAPRAHPPAEAPVAAPVPVAGLPDAPSFGAVRAGLASQIGTAKSCVRDQAAPSRVSLTFGSDGKVKSVGVTGPAGGTPAEECIRGAFQRSTVAPFSRPTFNVGFSLRPETPESDR